MIKFSIYTTAYNLKSGIFNLEESIQRFSDFADEIVIATNTHEDFTILESLQPRFPKLYNILAEIPLSDYAFDGKLKNVALQGCNGDFCILLDLDEYIPSGQRQNWEAVAHTFVSNLREPFSNPAALFIPVVDLIQDKYHYKSIGFKWYLHTKLGCNRGVVNFARKDNGKIDITKSDTTELIDYKGDLIPAAYLYNPTAAYEELLKEMKYFNVYVVHEGWLNKEQRSKQSEFWRPHWENRRGGPVDTLDLDSVYQQVYKEHNLHV